MENLVQIPCVRRQSCRKEERKEKDLSVRLFASKREPDLKIDASRSLDGRTRRIRSNLPSLVETDAYFDVE